MDRDAHTYPDPTPVRGIDRRSHPRERAAPKSDRHRFPPRLPASARLAGVRSASLLALLLVFAAAPTVRASPAVGSAASKGPPIAGWAVTPEGVQGQIREGRYRDAEDAARELLRQVEQIHGRESLEAARILDLLAEALRLGGKGTDPEALEVCRRAVAIKESTLGPNSLEYALSLHNLGALFLANGRYEEAREPLERALDIRRRSLGDEHPDVARSLMYTALLDLSLGDDHSARPKVERALTILQRSLPAEDPDVARGLNLLASIQYLAGDYNAAGALWERVLNIKLKTLAEDHPSIAECLQNLAAVYGEMGDYDASLQALDRALSIRRRSLGAEHPLVAETLVNIAIDLESVGDIDGARRDYKRALQIQRHAYPEGHPALAWTLMRLGRLALKLGDRAAAKRLLDGALAMQQKSLGGEHPQVAWTLKELATLDWKEGRTDAARSEFQRALRILRASAGPTHPDVVLTLGSYAGFLADAGQPDSAMDAALESARMRADLLRVTTRGLSERQALVYAPIASQGLDAAVMLVQRDNRVRRPGRIRAVWDILIRTRKAVLDEMANRHRAALVDSVDPDLGPVARDLVAARRRLANLLVRGVGAEEPEHYRAAIDRARNDVETDERELAARSSRFRADQKVAAIGWADVARALPPRSGLIAYALYDSAGTRSYAAFWMGPDGALAAVPIGPAKRIDSLTKRWAGDIANGGAGAAGEGRAETVCRASGAALRRSVWDPLSRYLAGLERVFVVPDGTLDLVNLAALPRDGGGYLIESDPEVHVLSAERDLCRYGSGQPTGNGLLALGGPSFDEPEATGSDPASSASTGAQFDAPRSLQLTRGPRGSNGEVASERPLPDCEAFRALRFRSLPEAALEVREIASAWGDSLHTVVLTGPSAGESALKRLAPGRRVLHLATHGFFLDAGQCLATGSGTRGIGGVSSGAVPLRHASSLSVQNPLLLSGLALAGANLRASAGPDQEDGILMAQEVASLDLSGVEWVVLSACDTGVGALQPGEGVVGLRRAFEIAGARTVFMSLWEVQDRTAREWMRNLYEDRYRRHMSTADSARDAALRMLRERRAQSRSTHPYFWAAFVAAGDWR